MTFGKPASRKFQSSPWCTWRPCVSFNEKSPTSMIRCVVGHAGASVRITRGKSCFLSFQSLVSPLSVSQGMVQPGTSNGTSEGSYEVFAALTP